MFVSCFDVTPYFQLTKRTFRVEVFSGGGILLGEGVNTGLHDKTYSEDSLLTLTLMQKWNEMAGIDVACMS